MSLSPFDIKGKGRMKTKTRFFSSCRKRSFVDLMCIEVIMLPLSSCWIFKHIFSNELHDSMTFPITKDSYLHQWSNQVDLHMRLKYPTKWVYTFDQVLSWLKNTILHHRSQHDLFIKLQQWPFVTNTKRTSKKRSYLRIIIMPTMHYTQQC